MLCGGDLPNPCQYNQEHCAHCNGKDGGGAASCPRPRSAYAMPLRAFCLPNSVTNNISVWRTKTLKTPSFTHRTHGCTLTAASLIYVCTPIRITYSLRKCRPIRITNENQDSTIARQSQNLSALLLRLSGPL